MESNNMLFGETRSFVLRDRNVRLYYVSTNTKQHGLSVQVHRYYFDSIIQKKEMSPPFVFCCSCVCVLLWLCLCFAVVVFVCGCGCVCVLLWLCSGKFWLYTSFFGQTPLPIPGTDIINYNAMSNGFITKLLRSAIPSKQWIFPIFADDP